MSEKLSEGDLLEYLDFWLMETHKPSKDEIRAYAQIKEIVTMWFTILETGAKTIDQEALQKPKVSREWICRQVDYWWNDCGFGGRIQPETYDIKGMVLDLFKELAEVTDENY